VFGLEVIATYPMAQFGDGGDFNQLWGLGLHFKHHASDHE
jgi:hypothetical protein